MTTEELTQGAEGASTETESQVTETATTENDGGEHTPAATGVTQAPSQIEGENSRLTPEKIASKAKARKTAAEAQPKTPESEAAPAATTQPPVVTSPAFTPNFKFKVMDQEHEIPEKFRELMKDATTEKEVREIFEKAYGLDHQKPKYEQLKTKHTEVERNFNDVLGAVQDLRSVYQQAVSTGNLLLLDDFFDRLKIPDQVILQYALAKVQYGELDPEARKAYDQQVFAQKRLLDLEKQNQGYSQQAMSAATHAKGALLDSCLARPDIQAIAQAFESTPGRKPGDFRKSVCEHGEYVWFKTNGQMDLSPEEAIQQVMQRFGVIVPPPGGQQAIPNTAANPTTTAPQQGNPAATTAAPRPAAPVIPNVASRAASPMKPRPKSIAELRKLGQAAST
ncbi:MAG: hypothetical protein JNL01_14070 [Bdellovibrionales bacterium]|nr:hypothetical protein [Bdellovibrionales bacterium]